MVPTAVCVRRMSRLKSLNSRQNTKLSRVVAFFWSRGRSRRSRKVPNLIFRNPVRLLGRSYVVGVADRLVTRHSAPPAPLNSHRLSSHRGPARVVSSCSWRGGLAANRHTASDRDHCRVTFCVRDRRGVRFDAIPSRDAPLLGSDDCIVSARALVGLGPHTASSPRLTWQHQTGFLRPLRQHAIHLYDLTP